MSVLLYDGRTDGFVSVGLRLVYNSASTWMAYVSSGYGETPNDVMLHDDTIANATIDNQNCIYMLHASITYISDFLILENIQI